MIPLVIELEMLLNETPEAMMPWRGYQAGDELRSVLVERCAESDLEMYRAEGLCERIWRRCQSVDGDHTTPYSGRSASVGDVVRVGDRYFACVTIGFEEIERT